MANTTNVTVILDDEKLEFVMDSDKTILDGALENGVDAPHSCQGGICTTCICKVISGKADMEDEYALSDEEQDEESNNASYKEPDQVLESSMDANEEASGCVGKQVGQQARERACKPTRS